MRLLFSSLATAMVFASQMVHAGACDYRPSALIGGGGAGATATGGALVAGAGAGAKAAGFYTLTHAVTGATMLGSAAGGASAAGTVGIMGGTAGVVGTAGAILMAPVTIAVGATAAAGVGGVEAYCYYAVDEKITTYDEVLERIEPLSDAIPPENFQFVSSDKSEDGKAFIRVRNGKGEMDRYSVDRLYIVNGQVRHRDFARDTRLPLVVGVPAAD